jgi:hypothetical protein
LPEGHSGITRLIPPAPPLPQKLHHKLLTYRL